MPFLDWTQIVERRHFLDEILEEYQRKYGTPPFPTLLNEEAKQNQVIHIAEDRDIEDERHNHSSWKRN